MTLEDVVEKLFADNPDLSEDEAVKKLKEMKEPKSNKSMWKATTIRNRVNAHVRKNGKGINIFNDASNKSPVETKGFESDLKIEGKEIERHRPKDPFAIKPEENVGEKVDKIVGEKVDKMKEMGATADVEQFKKGIIDSVSEKVLELVSAETKSFKEETISIVSDLKSSVVDVITGMKEDMIKIQKQGLTAYEPVVEYEDINLKQSTVEAIQKNTEEKELEEESEYVDNLIENEKEYTSVLRVYHKLIDLAKEAKDGVQLRLFYRDDKLSYEKKPVGRFGISPKNLFIIGIAIGIGICTIIWLIYPMLTSVPPPISPPIP